MYLRWIGILQTFQWHTEYGIKNGLWFLLTMWHNCSWQHHLYQKGRWTLKKYLMEFASNMARLAIWTRYCSCLFCLTLCCINWICRTHRKVTADSRWTLLQDSCFVEETARQPDRLQCSYIMKECARQSAGHKEKWLTNCQYKKTV